MLQPRAAPPARRVVGIGLGALAVAAAAQVAVPVPLSPVPMTLQPLAVLAVGGLLGAGGRHRGAGALPGARHHGIAGVRRRRERRGAPYRTDRRLSAGVPGGGRAHGCAGRPSAGIVARVLGACALGMVVIHVGGVAQLAVLGGDPSTAFRVGFVPFLTGDLVKVGLAAAVIVVVRPMVAGSIDRARAAPRPRPVLRAVGAIVVVLPSRLRSSVASALAVRVRLTHGLTSDGARGPSPGGVRARPGPGAALAFGIATWIVGRAARSVSTPPRSVGGAGSGWLRGLGVGLAIGIVPAVVAMSLGVFTAGAGWSYDGGTPVAWLSQAGKTVLDPEPGGAGRGADVSRPADGGGRPGHRADRARSCSSRCSSPSPISPIRT